MARVDPYKNFRFRVEIDGVTQAGFTECTGLGSRVEVIEYREGGDPTAVRKLPGRVSYPDVMLKWGVTDSRELYNWHRVVVQGQVERGGAARSFYLTIRGRRRSDGIWSMPGPVNGMVRHLMQRVATWPSRR